jgi:NAD(P)-dependent dehydrogenase (short-subunit alcohol dehydrogenase family)
LQQDQQKTWGSAQIYWRSAFLMIGRSFNRDNFPVDVVAAGMFLLSGEVRYVNGANIQVSGGWGV